MKKLKQWAKNVIPHGFIEMRRRRYYLRKLGLKGHGNPASILNAVRTCRFDLWPKRLRSLESFVLVDVGANRGEFLNAVELLVPVTKAFLIEPQKHCCEILRQRAFEKPFVVVIESAAGSRNGWTALNACRDDKLSSILTPSTEIAKKYPPSVFESIKREQIRLSRLDDVIPPEYAVSLFKLDVQGYELHVLEGAVELLRRTDAILFELNYQAHYEGGAEFAELNRFLIHAGFRLYGISEPFFASGQPMWADVIYARERI